MPAEWEPQSCTWLGWPVLDGRETLWGEHYQAVCLEFARVAQTIAKYQTCKVTAYWPCVEQAKRLCGSDVEVIGVGAEDNWLRDFGPIFLTGPNSLAAAIFQFNAWGEKYPDYDGCKQLGEDIAILTEAKRFHSDMVLEGGAFYADGNGTLLTTESCLLNPNRNPRMSKADIEAELKRMLGAEKIIWLPGNPLETETNGHIDGIAAFVAGGKLLFQSANPDQGEYYRIMQENRRAIELATDACGRRFEIIDLPAPIVTEHLSDDRNCDCYANYILVNGGLIASAFGTPQDALARKVFEKAFPGRRIEMLSTVHIGMGGGSIHCSTQQQPATP